MARKIWNLMFVAGNPALFSRTRSAAGNPMSRAEAMEGASKVAANGWRVWVEHQQTGLRIFESEMEKATKAGTLGWFRVPGELEGVAPIRYGEEVSLLRGSELLQVGPGRRRTVRARLDKVIGERVYCTLLQDDPDAITAPKKAGESGFWDDSCIARSGGLAPFGAT